MTPISGVSGLESCMGIDICPHPQPSQYCQQWRRNAMADPDSAVTPSLPIPSPRYYRHARPHYRGKPAVRGYRGIPAIPIQSINQSLFVSGNKNPYYRAAL